MSSSLVGQVAYHAYSDGSDLVILAAGRNPTPGYQNQIKDIGNNLYELICKGPSSPVAQVVTLFGIAQQFRGKGGMRCISIKDENGTHDVPVHTLK